MIWTLQKSYYYFQRFDNITRRTAYGTIFRKSGFMSNKSKAPKIAYQPSKTCSLPPKFYPPPPVSFSLFWYCSSCNLSCRQAAMENKPYPPEQWRAWLTPVIFVVCIIMFVYTMHVNNCPAKTADSHQCVLRDILGRYSFQPWKENYLLGPSIST